MTISRDALPAVINQALYFARLQLDALDYENVDIRDDGHGFSQQHRQCFLDSAIIQLYRALCGLLSYSTSSVIDLSSIPTADTVRSILDDERALTVLNMPSLALSEMNKLIDAFDRAWQLNISTSRGTSSTVGSTLLATDAVISPQDCHLWHQEITRAIQLCVELGQEY